MASNNNAFFSMDVSGVGIMVDHWSSAFLCTQFLNKHLCPGQREKRECRIYCSLRVIPLSSGWQAAQLKARSYLSGEVAGNLSLFAVTDSNLTSDHSTRAENTCKKSDKWSREMGNSQIKFSALNVDQKSPRCRMCEAQKRWFYIKPVGRVFSASTLCRA